VYAVYLVDVADFLLQSQIIIVPLAFLVSIN